MFNSPQDFTSEVLKAVPVEVGVCYFSFVMILALSCSDAQIAKGLFRDQLEDRHRWLLLKTLNRDLAVIGNFYF